MSVALKLYERITSADDDQARFRAVADAIDALEQQLPVRELLATKTDLSETELRLRKEIEQLRAETSAMELRLQKEIEQVRLTLGKDIEQVRLETRSVEARLLTAIHRQTVWTITAVGAVVGLVRLLDYLLA
jgi:hypothetical protein